MRLGYHRGESAKIEAKPSTLVPKGNTDRSCSDDKRVIADRGGIDLYFDTSEFYPVDLPTVRDIENHITALNRKFPQANILLTNRDIESALRFIRIHPHLAKSMAAEFA